MEPIARVFEEVAVQVIYGLIVMAGAVLLSSVVITYFLVRWYNKCGEEKLRRCKEKIKRLWSRSSAE